MNKPPINLSKTDLSVLSNEILVSKGASMRIRVGGESMNPFIKSGEIIEVKPVKISEIIIGDVVFCNASWGGMIAHRLAKKHRENNKMVLVTKGDSNLFFDTPVHGDSIIGKVIAIEKTSGTTNLESKTWRITNYVIARYSVLSLLIYRGICFLKGVLIGNRENRFVYIGSKVLFFSLSLFPKLLINFLCFIQNLKSKLYLIRGG